MILGIDFGTSKSVVAVWENGQPVVIPDLSGRRTMPSVVMVAPDERLYVGWEARNHPARYESEHFTISSIKRLMGKAGETGWGHFRTYPQEVSALILGRLKMQAETYLGREVTGAVIAVPAHYDINQRWATLQAAEIAGLKAYRLVNEATAAVLTFSILQKRPEGVALVFDFGGGTLDVSIVRFGDRVYEVLATAGDDRLGGDDFDAVILEHVLQEAKKRLGASLQLSPLQVAVLKEAATRAKIDLSTAQTTTISLPGFFSGTNGHQNLDVSLDRGTFERLCGGLFDRAMAVLQRALTDAGGALTDTPLTDVLLVGGTCRIPCVRDMVRQKTGLAPRPGVDPETGVAQGASIQAAVLSGAYDDVLLLDAVAATYSVAMKGDVASPIIERNTTIPVRRSHPFTTTADNQTEVTVRVVQGESAVASQNILVGEIHLVGLPPAPAGIAQIEVSFEIDAESTFSVRAQDRATGREVKSAMEAPYRLNPAQVRVLQRKVAQELQAARQAEGAARERQRAEMAGQAALALAAKVEGLLVRQAGVLGAHEAALLAGGRDLIRDYAGRGVPPQDLEALVSHVSGAYSSAVLSLLEAAVRSLAASPELARWLDETGDAWQTPAVLAATLADFGSRFKDDVDRIVALMSDQEPQAQPPLAQQLLAKLSDSPAAVLCAEIILIRQAQVRAGIHRIPAGKAGDRRLAHIFWLGELAQNNPEGVRRAAAQEVQELCRGSECFFLGEYLALETDPEVTQRLEDCLRAIPLEAWLRRYFGAEPMDMDGDRDRLAKGAAALKNSRDAAVWHVLPPDVRRFFEMVRKTGDQGGALSVPDKLFLWKLARDRHEFAPAANLLPQISARKSKQ